MRCESSNVCVPLAMKCDGWKDCVGGEDEQVVSSELIPMRMYCVSGLPLKVNPPTEGSQTSQRKTSSQNVESDSYLRGWNGAGIQFVRRFFLLTTKGFLIEKH